MNAEANGGAAVQIETDEGFVLAQLVHAPANPLSPLVLDGLTDAVDTVQRSGSRTLVIASGIDGFFAAGADIKHMTSLDGAGFAAYGERMRAVFARINGLDAVSIAAIDGLALGGGLELALACTLRVGSRRARLGVPEIKLGLIPGAGGTQRLPRIVGASRALDLLLTGRAVDGAEAHIIGLLDRLVDDGEAEREAVAIARQLARFSIPAIEATSRCVAATSKLGLDEGIAFEAAEEQALFENGEALEGLEAFVARRPAVFRSAKP